jgi:hypothetical protein
MPENHDVGGEYAVYMMDQSRLPAGLGSTKMGWFETHSLFRHGRACAGHDEF